MSAAEVLRVVADLRVMFPNLETPYSMHLNTNYAAPQSEFPALRYLVSQHMEQLDAINIIIDQLHEKRSQIASSMRAHQGLISPVRHVPSELLQVIFLRCLPDETHVRLAKRTAPLLLTWICKRWREIALDTPELWTSLSVKSTGREPEEGLSFCRNWLKNTRVSPLTLEVNSLSGSTIDRRRKSVIEFSRLYTGRCRELRVAFDVAHGLDQLLVDIPILERLSLHGNLEMIGEEQTISITQPETRLRNLVIGSPTLDVKILSILNLGWTNLTHLAVVLSDLYHPGWRFCHTFVTLLRTCADLEHFVFSPACVFEVDETSHTHQKLRVLDISMLGYPMFTPGQFVFPNLHYLRVDTFFEDVPAPEYLQIDGSPHRFLSMTIEEEDIGPSLIRLFDPGLASVTHLRLNFDGEVELLELLQRCPNLEEVISSSHDIEGCFHSTTVIHTRLRSLTVGLGYGAITFLDTLTLPALRHLDLKVREGSTKWSHMSFKKFIFRSHCPLEMLTIKGPQISIDEEWEEYAALIPTLRRLDLYHTKEGLADMPVYSRIR